MLEITVKTLDNTFKVEENMTVREFKEVIFPKVGIPVQNQKLISKGRVLHDDKLISEYGNMVHLVHKMASNSSTAEQQNLEDLSIKSDNNPMKSCPSLSSSSTTTAPVEATSAQMAKTSIRSPAAPAPRGIDVDDDDILELNIPRNKPSKMHQQSQKSSKQEPQLEDLLNTLPDEWRPVVEQDILRQLGLPNQPMFSPGYFNLFPRSA